MSIKNHQRSHLRSITEPSPVMVLRVLQRVEHELIARYAGVLDEALVRSTVRSSYEALQTDSTVSQFIVVLTERRAVAELDALAAEPSHEVLAA